MGGGAGRQLKEHDRRLEGHSERKELSTGEVMECSEVLISEWELCVHGGSGMVAE